MNDNNKDCPYNDCFGCFYCLSEWSEYYQAYIITGCTWTASDDEKEEELELETLIF